MEGFCKQQWDATTDAAYYCCMYHCHQSNLSLTMIFHNRNDITFKELTTKTGWTKKKTFEKHDCFNKHKSYFFSHKMFDKPIKFPVRFRVVPLLLKQIWKTKSQSSMGKYWMLYLSTSLILCFLWQINKWFSKALSSCLSHSITEKPMELMLEVGGSMLQYKGWDLFTNHGRRFVAFIISVQKLCSFSKI